MANFKVTYSKSGVNYDNLDKIKRLAQISALETSKNLSGGFKVVEESRGESAFVWDEGDSLGGAASSALSPKEASSALSPKEASSALSPKEASSAYKALVIEGLGTKSIVAQEVLSASGKSFFKELAQDTVAMIVNDLIVVGARPMVVNAYFGLGNSDWLLEENRGKDLISGFANACNLAGAVWGGGETPSLSGIINPDSIDLAGSAVGIITPKQRLTLGDKICDGDAIIFIESNGIHANGISLVRKIADKLPDRYKTKLPSGISLGESILRPTHIYSKVIEALFNKGIDIHYMSNITGHGFRKIMRAKNEFTYVIENLPRVDELFTFIKEKSGFSDEEMYGTFNMGAGFALILPDTQVQKAAQIITDSGFKAVIAGSVKTGEKQVLIKPLNITFKSESLNIR